MKNFLNYELFSLSLPSSNQPQFSLQSDGHSSQDSQFLDKRGYFVIFKKSPALAGKLKIEFGQDSNWLRQCPPFSINP